jgi:general secretion pathway protein A
MYRKFFGLSRSPFEISPDPRFYYPTSQHNEALANLWHGIESRKGFVVLTGEVGTGKSLLIRSFLDAMQGKSIRYAYVFNPRLSPDDFLAYILSDFGLQPAATRAQQLLEFNRFLIDVHRQGSIAALIIDEAHLLSWEMLEEIRLLTNIETSEQKLLQIVLAGQNELDRRMEEPNLRQLKQRIALRCRLAPLAPHDVRSYIVCRLQFAGAEQAKEIFTPEAIERIQAYSGGIPRLVNTVCENALVTAYARQVRSIPASVIEQVATDFHLFVPQPVTLAEADIEAVHEAEDRQLVRRLARLLQLLDRKPAASSPGKTSQGAKVQ